MSITTAIILDKRSSRMNKKTKCFQVCIRVTFQRQPRTFSIGIEMKEADFKKLRSPRLGENLSAIKQKIKKEEERALFIIKNLNKFSFSVFADQFYAFQPGARRKKPQKREDIVLLEGSKEIAPKKNYIKDRENFINQFGGRKYPRKKSEIDFRALGEVAVYFGNYITKLEAKDQVGTLSIYVTALMSLLKFKPQLRFSDVTDLWLYQYEKWLKDQGRSITTVSIYMRCLRKVFNTVIAKKLIDRDLYPFGRELYVVPAARKRKKALNITDIQALYEYDCGDNEIRQKCKDLWFFMYVGNGMNAKDMCLLKYENISERFCRFIRAKTVNTTRENQQTITFFCDDFILDVIAKWGNPDQSPDNYIFEFLKSDMDAYGIRHQVQLVSHLINKHMYAIAEELEISLLPGTNDARHACATQLKRAGKSTEFIRELLGHLNAKTTQDYFDDFEDEVKTDVSMHLLPFRKRYELDGNE